MWVFVTGTRDTFSLEGHLGYKWTTSAARSLLGIRVVSTISEEEGLVGV